MFGLRHRKGQTNNSVLSLREIPPGNCARITALDDLSPAHREHLQAYGLAPGCWVQVIQHAPVTVVQVEHTELAFEAQLAQGVLVENQNDK